ncbi:MAG: 3-deoxy-D-manno-octulosonic acid transferase [Pseudomonadota bacterium]
MIWLYRSFSAFVLLICWFLSPFSSKLRAGLLGRRGLCNRLSKTVSTWTPEERRIWIHFSSAGEFETALPLLDSLKKTDPNIKIAITYFSPSAEKAIDFEKKRRQKASLSCPWDFADFSPFDSWKSVNHFLSTLKPSCYASIHRELWPEILYQCNQHNIPTFLLGAFFPHAIEKRQFLYRFCLKLLTHVITLDEESQTHLRTLDPDLRISVEGDPRIERVIFRKNTFSKAAPWKPFFENQAVLVGASLWNEDFERLLPSMKQVLESYPKARWILVPHEPSTKRVQTWKRTLKENGFPFRQWSHWLESPDDHSHLLVDQVGLLAELYSVATSVFVGGSFKKRVHNILEPLVYRCALITGPFIQNSREAIQLAERGVLRVVHNPQELTLAFLETLTASQKNQVNLEKAEEFLNKNKTVSKNYTHWLLA